MSLRLSCVATLLVALLIAMTDFQLIEAEQLSKRGSSEAGVEKRYYDASWINPAYDFSSMADADWNWEKRTDTYDPNKADVEKEENGNYEARPVSLALRRVWPRRTHFLYDPRMGSVNYRFQRRPFSNAYSFHSMADADWGMRRKRGPETKRHLASLKSTRPILQEEELQELLRTL